MKTVKTYAALTLLCSMAMMATSCRNSQSATAATAPEEYSAQVVVRDGEVEGILKEEKATTYVVSVQDDVEVSKAGAKVELWKAADGKGFVYLKNWGKQNVYEKADSTSAVAGVLVYDEGYLPDAYPCKGYENGWFALELNSSKVYAPASSLEWSAINPF